MRVRTLFAGAITFVTIGAFASPAFADPTGSKNAFPVHADCDNGQSIDVVVNSANGQGQGAQNKEVAVFTPAHVIGTNEIFHPTTLDLTFTFTPTEGPAQAQSQFATRPNQTGNLTCDISSIQESPDGTFSLTGTVTGWIS
ncbi:MAG TPA: hypothetical protein VL856_20585 [Acidimicrobiia bacterium]|jgi:hypothetical protein|nr:hypothetical protein [Acidimicrobiia bacterium]